jgi:hypothetical protein
MIAPVRVLCLTSWLWLTLALSVSAHDLERTQVSLSFARDGSFVLDVTNDSSWLKLRTESVRGDFADRIVLWVDGREVRPASVEYMPPRPQTAADDLSPPATYRLRGRVPLGARTLRWYYGLVIDPYPLTVRRADGRVLVEEIGGDAWSRTIDLGPFSDTRARDTFAQVLVVGLLLVPVVLRVVTRRSRAAT